MSAQALEGVRVLDLSRVLAGPWCTQVLGDLGANYLVSGQVPGRAGNAHQNIVPYQVFEVADGHLILAVGNDSQFTKFCAAAGRPELAEDPRFAKNADRVPPPGQPHPACAGEQRAVRGSAPIRGVDTPHLASTLTRKHSQQRRGSLFPAPLPVAIGRPHGHV